MRSSEETYLTGVECIGLGAEGNAPSQVIGSDYGNR